MAQRVANRIKLVSSDRLQSEPQIAVLDAGTPALGICHGLLAIALVSGVLSAGYLYGQPAVGSQIASIIPIEPPRDCSLCLPDAGRFARMGPLGIMLLWC